MCFAVRVGVEWQDDACPTAASICPECVDFPYLLKPNESYVPFRAVSIEVLENIECTAPSVDLYCSGFMLHCDYRDYLNTLGSSHLCFRNV